MYVCEGSLFELSRLERTDSACKYVRTLNIQINGLVRYNTKRVRERTSRENEKEKAK